MTEKTQILKSASIISLVTIVSRILGYVRDQRISFLLGTTLSADAFVLAYRLPNLFRRMVGDGVVTASFIPVFTTYMRDSSSEELWRFANRLFWTLALVLAIVTVLGVIFSPVVIQSFSSPQDRASSWNEAIALNRIIFPYLFFAGLAALGMGILNSYHNFALPAATTALQNLAIIIFSTALVWHYFQRPAVSLAVGVLVGGALQFLILVPQLVRRGMRFDFGISFAHPGVKNFARLMFPRFFGMGIAQINFFVDTFFVTAPRMPRGSLAALYVSDRVMELVLGGYAIAVATAILPMMSHQAAANDYEGLKRTLTFARAHRCLHHHSRRSRPHDPARTHHPHAFPTRPIRCRIYPPHRPPAALLRCRSSRARLCQAHRARVLFRGRHQDPRHRRAHFLCAEHYPEHHFSAIPLQPLSEWRPGPGHRPCDFL